MLLLLLMSSVWHLCVRVCLYLCLCGVSYVLHRHVSLYPVRPSVHVCLSWWLHASVVQTPASWVSLVLLLLLCPLLR